MAMEKVLTILEKESGEKLCPVAWAPSTSWYRRAISEAEQRLRLRSRRCRNAGLAGAATRCHDEAGRVDAHGPVQ
jgi:hypothetical protein